MLSFEIKRDEDGLEITHNDCQLLDDLWLSLFERYLSPDPDVERLTLVGCRFVEKTATKVLAMIGQMPGLRTLELRGCGNSCAEERDLHPYLRGRSALPLLTAINPSLSELRVIDSGTRGEWVADLLFGLSANTHLKTLHIESCDPTPLMRTALITLLGSNRALKSIDVRLAPLEIGVDTGILEAVTINGVITTLNP